MSTLHQNKKTLLIWSIVLLSTTSLVVVTYAVFNAQYRVPSSGITVEGNLGLYSNLACTNPIPSSGLVWGTLLPDSSSIQTIYIRNEVNVPLKLAITMADVPNIAPLIFSNYFSLTTSYNNSVLVPTQVLPVQITLKISPDAPGLSFNFNIRIECLLQ
ncbi:hypothetical protein MUP77_08190 [Candidatus Bathyarchaeota archaeon]|nr:hypothetical protein [Candidatus Bathyarchaeota archaeon]